MIVSFIKTLAIILIPAIMQVGFISSASVEPEEAVDELMKGIQAGDQAVMEKYMDNKYINFLQNVEADKEQLAAINTALLGNFQYEIENVGTKNDVAVAKVKVVNNDFSRVDNKYEEEAYEYIMDNLYSEKISDKKALNGKCLDIYIDELQKAAKKDADKEQTIYVAMTDNGHYGWNVMLSEKNMKKILGNYDIPVK